MDRPDFIPWMWSRGRRNRLLWSRPDKVLRWFIYAVPGAALFALLGWLDEDPGFGYFMLAGASVIWLQALVYAPRAWRASRRRERAEVDEDATRTLR